jgi:hypothetical protein
MKERELKRTKERERKLKRMKRERETHTHTNLGEKIFGRDRQTDRQREERYVNRGTKRCD